MSSAGGPTLEGLRVAVTRPDESAGGLAAALSARGAVVYEHSAIRLAPPEDPAPLTEAARRLADYDWVLFTSANGVRHFARALAEAGGQPASAPRVACVGPATAAAAHKAGFPRGLTAARHLSEGLVETLKEAGSLDGRRVLLPRSQAGSDVLPDALRALGADVDEVAAYRPAADAPELAALARRVAAGEVDVVALASASAASAYAERVGAGQGGAGGVLFACIGPVTAAAARASGLSPLITAEEHTGAGLVAALEAWRRGGSRR